MPTPKIGWLVDRADTNSDQTNGTNTVLARFTAISTARAAGTSVSLNDWQSAIKHLYAHMMISTPEDFLDGPDGFMLAPLVEALGGNVSSTPAAAPAAPFTLHAINDRIIEALDVVNEKIKAPDWVNVATIAWSMAGSGTITLANDTTDTVEITGVATGVETVTATVTAVDGSVETSVFTVTIL